MRQKRQKSRRKARPASPAPLPLRSLDLEIESLGAQGDGLARDDRDDPVYVPRTVPGDRVRADVRGNRAETFELLASGPHRVSPPCPHYAECGGCSLQHVSKELYRKTKRAHLLETLSRAGLKCEDVTEHWCGPGTRRRVTLKARGRKERALIGFQEKGSHKLVDISSCLLLTPTLQAALPDLRTLAAELLAPGEEASLLLTDYDNGIELAIVMDETLFEARRVDLLMTLGTSSASRAFIAITLNDEPGLVLQSPRIHFDGFEVSPPPGAFLQPSREGEGVLLKAVLANQPAPEFGRALDLFAGCGTYALPLARTYQVTAYEGVEAQVETLNTAAGQIGIKGLKALRRDLFREPLGEIELKKVDYVVLNPPRAGARDQALALASSKVPRITYVSCNPGTLARDGGELLKGGYRLSSLTLLDQFVYSPHMECVAVFDKMSA